MNKIVQTLLLLEFEVSDFSLCALMALYLAGLWKLLVKSGLKGWWALIPGARDYQLACCAGREAEGRVYSVTGVAILLLNLIALYLNRGSDPESIEPVYGQYLLIIILNMTLSIIRFIYHVRVWSGMIEVYGVRKRWMLLCLTEYTIWIPALVWGWVKKYQPEWKVEDIHAEMARLATSGSATVMDEGLTVNLKERTVRQFFQKRIL